MENGKLNFNSVTFRLFIIGVLILVLMIPSIMIGALIGEREERQQEAVAEITSKWAMDQTVGGPVITIPFEKYEKDSDGNLVTITDYLHLLPQTLTIQGKMFPKVRYRGIYKAILYNTQIKLSGSFDFSRLNNLDLEASVIKWNNAFIAIQIPDMRGIKENVTINWSDAKFQFEPGIREGNFFKSGISVKLPLEPGTLQQTSRPFSINLDLNGSESFHLLPIGQKTLVNLNSSWNNPSFDGAFLPETRKVTQDGFQADWKVLDLNRNYPQQWVGDTFNENIQNSAFGVRFISPVDQYSMVNRAIKYIIMFVGLTFLIFFLIEIFNKKRIHPVQYLLVGLALCIFYVLLLSLSEHIPFGASYVIAAIAVISIISMYVRSALGGWNATLITSVLLAALYGYLFILINLFVNIYCDIPRCILNKT
jgi:inner membrane protein